MVMRADFISNFFFPLLYYSLWVSLFILLISHKDQSNKANLKLCMCQLNIVCTFSSESTQLEISTACTGQPAQQVALCALSHSHIALISAWCSRYETVCLCRLCTIQKTIH